MLTTLLCSLQSNETRRERESKNFTAEREQESNFMAIDLKNRPNKILNFSNTLKNVEILFFNFFYFIFFLIHFYDDNNN